MKPTAFPLELNLMPGLAVAGAGGATALKPGWAAPRYATLESRPAVRAGARRQPVIRVEAAARWESFVYGLVAVCAAVPLVSAAFTTGGFATNFGQVLEWVRQFGL
jgi:hypothetical protein